jgi:SnoaL-like domain
MNLRGVAAATAIVVGLALIGWYVATPAEEGAAVRRRLHAFSDEVNRHATQEFDPDARAARFGAFFTDDADVDFGQGAAPIKGRETIAGMAARLQPRTAAFTLKFEDVTVAMAPSRDAADVHLTAEFIRRIITTGEQSLDAREFTVGMRQVAGEWKIARVTAVDTLK